MSMCRVPRLGTPSRGRAEKSDAVLLLEVLPRLGTPSRGRTSRSRTASDFSALPRLGVPSRGTRHMDMPATLAGDFRPLSVSRLSDPPPSTWLHQPPLRYFAARKPP